MNAARSIRAAIRLCGREIALEQAGTVYRFIACIQPRSYDTQMRTRDSVSRFGRVDPREYVYYGPPDGGGELVLEDTVLAVGDTEYVVTYWHDFHFQGQCVFRWAVLRRVDRGDAV